MENTPKVSIILAVNTLNPFLDEAINSVLLQTYENFDFYIIANNCSNELMDLLKKYQDARIKLFRTHIGQLSFNLNFAINLSDAELVARMDADDVCHVDRIRKQVDYFLKHPEVDVLGTHATMINSSGETIGRMIKPLNNDEIRKTMWVKNPLVHPSIMYKRKTVLSAGAYLGGQSSEDYSLWLRLARSPKVTFANLDEELLKYRIHPKQSKGSLLPYCEIIGHMSTEFFLRPSPYKLWAILVSVIKVIKRALL